MKPEPTAWTTKDFQGFDLDVEVGMSESEWSNCTKSNSNAVFRRW